LQRFYIVRLWSSVVLASNFVYFPLRFFEP
jgi:hypothetical protein